MNDKHSLIKQCFTSVNNFKRHRVLSEVKHNQNLYDDSTWHKLKAYQYFDNLELNLRALQREMYNKEEIEVSDGD